MILVALSVRVDDSYVQQQPTSFYGIDAPSANTASFYPTPVPPSNAGKRGWSDEGRGPDAGAFQLVDSPTSVAVPPATTAADLDQMPRRGDDHSKHKPPPLRPAPEHASNSFSSESNYEEDEFEDARDDNGRREDGYAVLPVDSRPSSVVRHYENAMPTPRIDGVFLKSSPTAVPPGAFVLD
ncbi:hypothetical protein EXIGLDRAFT_766920 [Exidia glandulosa HHB12029]|uniref:Uncharacterized protein n=1 Tax=Exidia glandulosa HHB12029 TaxID=1314781 RepID=A0A165JC50_EXIGL|nr:hypothetical protein EXIGLDRAFT_766920 [Exidia glandulosa HHB12029]